MSARAQRNFRRIAQVALVENGEAVIDVPNVHHIKSIQIALSGTLTISTANSTATPAHSPSELIKRVDLIANGREVLEQVPFRIACFGNYQRKFHTEVTPPGVTQAAHAFRAVGYYDRINFDGPRPKDSAFKAKAHASDLFQLRLTFGAKTDISTNASAANLALSNVLVEVSVEALVEKDADANEPKAIKKRTLQTVQVSSANTNLRVPLPRGNRCRLVGVLATDDGEPTDSLINSVEFAINGIDVKMKDTYKNLRSLNSSDKQVTVPTGFVFLDSAPDGSLAEVWDLSNVALAEVVIDHAAPSGAGQLDLVIEEMLPPQ